MDKNKPSRNTKGKTNSKRKSTIEKASSPANKCKIEPTAEVILTVPGVKSQSVMLPRVIAEHYGLCSCCLELPCPKNMWTECTWMGQTEVYGEMIQECFGITFTEDLKPKQQICQVCVTRVRDSLRFKQQVVACTARLKEKLAALDTSGTVKQEAVGTENYHNVFDAATDIAKIEIEEEDVLHPGTAEHSLGTETDVASDDDEVAGGVSKTTPDKKVARKESLTVTVKDGRSLPRPDQIRPRTNIGLLLQHTTILPFKSNKGYFNCFYCNKLFVVVEQLRSHVQSNHNDVTLKSIIKHILRPHDRIKADISNITCRICDIRLGDMSYTVKHLEEHGIKFNYHETLQKPVDCLLCYDLSDGKFRCVVCGADFHFFKTLTKHMNEHSTNYVCDVCGKCFLLAERLKAHTQVHSKTAVHCDLCGKMCVTMGRLRSHKRHHHKKRSHVCGICNQPFPTFRQRMQHFEEMHNRTPLNLNCKICLKTFKTTSHLGCHMRTEHLNMPYVRKRKKKCD